MNGYADLMESISRPSPRPDDSEAALRSTYRWIEAFIASRRYSPTLFEMAEGLGISYQAARTRRVKMEQRRWLSCDGKMRSIILLGIPAADLTPGQLDYSALASLVDHLACAIAGHPRAAELFALFGTTYHVEVKRLEMEAAYQQAESVED